MGLFSKPEYKEVYMPFIVDDFTMPEIDNEAGIINLEAYGYIDGIMKYFYTSYILKNTALYDDGTYEKMNMRLKEAANQDVLIKLKYKKKKLVDFELDIDYLAKMLSDDNFKQFERIGWGINDKSCK